MKTKQSKRYEPKSAKRAQVRSMPLLSELETAHRNLSHLRYELLKKGETHAMAEWHINCACVALRDAMKAMPRRSDND